MSRVFRRNDSWWIYFRDAQGVRRRKKIGPNKRIAREVLDNYLGKVARQEHLGLIDDSPISFADFAAEWLKRIEPTIRPRTRERWTGIVEQHLKPHFAGALRGVTAADAQRYVASRIEQGAQPSTINREMTVLKHMLRRAVAWKFLSRNPFLDGQGNLVDGLRDLKEPPGRTRFLNLDEVDRLLQACESIPYLKAFTILALNTGMRRNEILSLTRKSIDWQNRIARLTDTKNGEARHVYLNSAAIEALRSLPPRIGDARLFPFNPNQVSIAFMRAVRRAGIEDFRLHDCRHCFASAHAMAGLQGRALQALLGHKDGRMTARYSHLSDSYLRAAVDAVQLGASPNSAASLAQAK